MNIEMLKERNSTIVTKIAEYRNKISNSTNEFEIRMAGDMIEMLENEKTLNSARIEELATRSADYYEVMGKANANSMKEVENFRKALMSAANVRSANALVDALPAVPAYISTEIVKKMETYGKLLNMVKKTTKAGTQTFPRWEGKITAEWQDGENTSANRQALEALGEVTLNAGYFLRATVSYSELTDIATVTAWVDTFADEVAKAVVLKLEAGIINADGNKKMTGIINDANVTTVTLTADELANPDTIITLTADLDEAYQNGTIAMNYASFVGFKTLKDEAGHYVGFVGDNGNKHIYDKDVITTSAIKSIKAANVGDVIMVYGDFSDYRINFQTDIIIDRYFDNDLRQYVIDVVCYADGKVVDPFSFIVVKKG